MDLSMRRRRSESAETGLEVGGMPCNSFASRIVRRQYMNKLVAASRESDAFVARPGHPRRPIMASLALVLGDGKFMPEPKTRPAAPRRSSSRCKSAVLAGDLTGPG